MKKGFILFLVVIFSLTLLVSVENVQAVSCTCATGLPGCAHGECGVAYEGSDASWSCMIVKQDCDCTGCGGSTPCCYATSGQTPSQTDRASCSSNYADCKREGCPNTNLYDGEKCELVDHCWRCDIWGPFGWCLLASNHCRGKWGKWDSSQMRCVECNGKKQGRVIADNNQKCFDAPDGCSGWNDKTCAYTQIDTCESACGADDECDDKSDGVVCRACPNNLRPRTCSNCQCPSCLPRCYSSADCVAGYSCCIASGECIYNNEFCGNTPGQVNSCNKAGKDWFRDTCGSDCKYYDSNVCEDDYSGCTAASACDGKNPGDICQTSPLKRCNNYCECVEQSCTAEGQCPSGWECCLYQSQCVQNFQGQKGSRAVGDTCYWYDENCQQEGIDSCPCPGGGCSNGYCQQTPDICLHHLGCVEDVGWVGDSDWPAPDCGPTYDPCKTLLELILYGTWEDCYGEKYEPVTDINKDGDIDLTDVGLVVTNYGNKDWCQEKLNERTNPCTSEVAQFKQYCFSGGSPVCSSEGWSPSETCQYSQKDLCTHETCVDGYYIENRFCYYDVSCGGSGWNSEMCALGDKCADADTRAFDGYCTKDGCVFSEETCQKGAYIPNDDAYEVRDYKCALGKCVKGTVLYDSQMDYVTINGVKIEISEPPCDCPEFDWPEIEDWHVTTSYRYGWTYTCYHVYATRTCTPRRCDREVMRVKFCDIM